MAENVQRHLAERIRECEESLLHCTGQHCRELLEGLLAPDFQEVGPQGRVSGRAEVLHWLLEVKDPAARWELRDFRLRELGEGLVLARYHARRQGHGASAGSLRSSLWRRRAHGGWELLFHQATPLRD